MTFLFVLPLPEFDGVPFEVSLGFLRESLSQSIVWFEDTLSHLKGTSLKCFLMKKIQTPTKTTPKRTSVREKCIPSTLLGIHWVYCRVPEPENQSTKRSTKEHGSWSVPPTLSYTDTHGLTSHPPEGGCSRLGSYTRLPRKTVPSVSMGHKFMGSHYCTLKKEG